MAWFFFVGAVCFFGWLAFELIVGPPPRLRGYPSGGKVPTGELRPGIEPVRPPVGPAGSSAPRYYRCYCGGQYVLPDAPRPQAQERPPEAPSR